jgi:dipeptidyl aminopeptidase/acylaminoacyl peptidase
MYDRVSKRFDSTSESVKVLPCIVARGWNSPSWRNLYRCAVSIGGIADIGELVRDSKPKAFRAIASDELRIKERIGSESDANLARRSPINSAKNIHIPVLLLDGIGDTEEIKHQSGRMADAMRLAGKPVELGQFRTHNEMLREIEDFLKTNL